MCRVCVEYALGKLTAREALRNAGEIFTANYQDRSEWENGNQEHLGKVLYEMAEKVVQENHDREIIRWQNDGGHDGVPSI